MKHGDYTELADHYARYRPGYSPVIRDLLLSLPGSPVDELNIADVGAGTGIWTRMMAEKSPASLVAVEPNDPMRKKGKANKEFSEIAWRAGSAEATALEDQSLHMLTMASSFHWADFDAAIAEFSRVLRPGAWFVALWNPRHLEVNPLLIEIEEEMKRLTPNIKRVASGNSEFTNRLLNRLQLHPLFDHVVYLEGFHVENMSKERYLGIWKSVNDIQVQMGRDRFEQFIDFIDRRIPDGNTIEAMYQTRAWAARLAET